MKYRYREQHEMKDSGVEWLGMIPNEWEVKQLKYIFNTIQTGTTPSSSNEYFFKNGKINWFTPGDLKNDFLIESDRKITDLAISNKEVKEFNENSFVIVGIGATAGKIGFSKSKLTFNQQLTGFYSNNNDNKFYFYLMKSLGKEFLKLATFTTLPILNNEFFKKIKLSSLTFKSQQKIADFLDKKCEEFDSVIAKKEMLINKLEEAKKSLISEVVTGKVKVIQKENGEYGIIKREAHEMKDSGVEWLGMIPKEWKVTRLKYLFKITKRIAGKEGYSVLSITQKGIRIKDITSGGGQLSMDYSKYQIVNYGDFAMNHMDLLTGYVDISKFSGVTSPDYRVFNLRNKENIPEYLLLLLQLGYRNKIFFRFGQGSSQLGRWRFPTDQFYDFIFPIPSKEEQNIVSKCIFYKIKNIDKIIEKQKESIEKLKSAKQSLISEAVTGKIEIL